MAAQVTSGLRPRQLSLPGKTLPPSIPLILSCEDNWNTDTCTLETGKPAAVRDIRFKVVEDALALLRGIDKPLAVLSICGPYRSGKSYFISRVLGSPGAFKLGHSMQACTRGIWIATTVLENQEFAAVLLDTEGIDAVGASETVAMSLLTLTTLLSSFLIYNSKKVPQKVDLSKMKCFTQISTSILAQRGTAFSTTMKSFSPHFLWLLRDVSLNITDKEGKEIEPTEFLHTRILKGESGEFTELGRSLVSIFPCLECATLPIPSIKPKIIRNIVEKQNELKPKFNTALDNLVETILDQLTPKKAMDGITLVNGCTLATLACEYVEAISKPGAVPDLDQGWQAVVCLEVKQYCDKLVGEYKTEMEELLEHNMPMEESRLMRLHHEALCGKKKAFEEEIHRVSPVYSTDRKIFPLIHELEREIVQWNDEGKPVVVGGVLFHFLTENYAVSKEHCEKVFSDLLKESEIEAKTNTAILDSQPFNIGEEISVISARYNTMALGPAATGVMERGQLELQQLRDTLKMIPGKPCN